MASILYRRVIGCVVASLFLLLWALPCAAQTASGPPSVAAPIVREGDFARALQEALGLGSAADETEAETRLGEAGIAPRNGWIADYPVTPDVMGELRASVIDAGNSVRLKINGDEALRRLNDVSVQAGMPVMPYDVAPSQPAPATTAEAYPDPTVINNYYYTQGPPVVTYYTPPPDYYYLYTWVPYPFWYTGFWFPGFFVLHDFHRVVVVHGRPAFVSNHFNDVRVHRVFRVDPDRRFHGRTFAGIGAPRARGFVATGVPRSETRIFNAPRAVPGGRPPGAPPSGFRASGPAPRAFHAAAAPPSGFARSGPPAGMTRGGGAPAGGMRGGAAPAGGMRGGGGGGGHGGR